jgi:hypothetical protein
MKKEGHQQRGKWSLNIRVKHVHLTRSAVGKNDVYTFPKTATCYLTSPHPANKLSDLFTAITMKTEVLPDMLRPACRDSPE